MESLVFLAGALIIVAILAIFYYLVHESRPAFDRKFSYGFIFALQPTQGEFEKELQFDPNASILTCHWEGDDSLDAKEEGIPLGNLESYTGVASLVTVAANGGSSSIQAADSMYRDEWKGPKNADSNHDFVLYAFATPEFKQEKMVLAWDIQEGSTPQLLPYELQLELVGQPKGSAFQFATIDLKSNPKGRVELPTFVAHSDSERLQGYKFKLTAKPTSLSFLATARSFFSTFWAPTNAHPSYGMVPLLLSTMLITLIAVLLAAPIAIASAVYLAEIAPVRLRETMKPLIEMLASVPTIVLAYFGLMLLAPVIQQTVAQPLGLDSGRCLLTAALIMGVLIIPTILTLAEDALRSVPDYMRSGGEALGLTRKETLRKVVLPAAKAGIISAVMLGVARALGETMIVWVLSGGTPKMPVASSLTEAAKSVVQPTRGIADTIGIEMGNVTFGEQHYGHLFLLGLLLFVLTLILNLTAFKYARRHVWRH
jgi:phosphate ABC transporter permease protein PstC